MKTIKVLVILTFLLIISIIFLFGKGVALNSLTSTDEFGCQGMNETYVCGDTIYESCVMNGDLSTPGTCFTIGADNIIIDGNGFTIYYGFNNNSGPVINEEIIENSDSNISYFGIQSNGFEDVTIRNLNIVYDGEINPGFGIFINDSNNSLIEQVDLYGGKVGILIMNSNEVKIKNSLIQNMSYGAATAWATCSPFIQSEPEKYYESGIWFVESQNGTIYNNTFVGNMSESGIYNHHGMEAGVTLCRSNNTNISSNRLYGIDTFGFLLTGSYYNNLFYNFVNGSKKNGSANNNDGVIVGGPGGDSDAFPSHYNRLNHNTFIKCSEWGIFIGNSNFTYVYNNTAKYNDYVGIRIGGTSSHNLITKNIVNNNGAGHYAYGGIRCEGENNTLTDNILNSNYAGLIFNSPYSINNTAERITISNSSYGVVFLSSGSNNVADSIVLSSSREDVYTYSNPNNNTLLNVSFNKDSVGFAPGSNGVLYVQWYLDACVKYRNGAPAENATVTGYAVNETFPIFTEITGQDGYIPRQVLTEYVETSSGKTYLAPYTIKASKIGYITATKIVNLENNAIGSSEVVLTLIKKLNATPRK